MFSPSVPPSLSIPSSSTRWTQAGCIRCETRSLSETSGEDGWSGISETGARPSSSFPLLSSPLFFKAEKLSCYVWGPSRIWSPKRKPSNDPSWTLRPNPIKKPRKLPFNRKVENFEWQLRPLDWLLSMKPFETNEGQKRTRSRLPKGKRRLPLQRVQKLKRSTERSN